MGVILNSESDTAMTMTPWSLNQGCQSHRGPWLRMTFKIFWQPWSSWKCGIPWILGPNEFKSTKTSASEDWSRIKSSPLPTQLPGLTITLPLWMLYGAILRCSWLTRREMIVPKNSWTHHWVLCYRIRWKRPEMWAPHWKHGGTRPERPPACATELHNP